MTNQIAATGNKIVNEAIEEARQWLLAGCDTTDGYGRLVRKNALRTFEEAVFHDDLFEAVDECLKIARLWGAYSRDGFEKLAALTDGWYTPKEVPTTELDGNPATQQVRVVDLGRDATGDWLVALQWDCGNQTRELLARAIELGLLQTA
jgi:hypothetical protein